MDWVIAVTCFALMAILRKRSKPKFLWLIMVFLALVGGALFFTTGLGDWLTGLFAAVLGWFSGLFGASATQVAGGLVLLAVVVAFLDIVVDRRADKYAISALIFLPMLAVIAGGPIADAVTALSTSVQTVGHTTLGALIGG